MSNVAVVEEKVVNDDFVVNYVVIQNIVDVSVENETMIEKDYFEKEKAKIVVVNVKDIQDEKNDEVFVFRKD